MQAELSETVMCPPGSSLDQRRGFRVTLGMPAQVVAPAANSAQAGARSALILSPTHWERAGCLLWGPGQDLVAHLCRTSKCHCPAKTQLTLAEGSAGGLAAAPRGRACLE